jgi:hypothetical protein
MYLCQSMTLVGSLSCNSGTLVVEKSQLAVALLFSNVVETMFLFLQCKNNKGEIVMAAFAIGRDFQQ